MFVLCVSGCLSRRSDGADRFTSKERKSLTLHLNALVVDFCVCLNTSMYFFHQLLSLMFIFKGVESTITGTFFISYFLHFAHHHTTCTCMFFLLLARMPHSHEPYRSLVHFTACFGFAGLCTVVIAPAVRSVSSKQVRTVLSLNCTGIMTLLNPDDGGLHEPAKNIIFFSLRKPFAPPDLNLQIF